MNRIRITSIGILLLILGMTSPLLFSTGNHYTRRNTEGRSAGFYGTLAGEDPFEEDIQTKNWMEITGLHSLNYKGDGVTVAVIDSGLYSHSYFTSTLQTDLIMYKRINDDLSIDKTTNWGSDIFGRP